MDTAQIERLETSGWNRFSDKYFEHITGMVTERDGKIAQLESNVEALRAEVSRLTALVGEVGGVALSGAEITEVPTENEQDVNVHEVNEVADRDVVAVDNDRNHIYDQDGTEVVAVTPTSHQRVTGGTWAERRDARQERGRGRRLLKAAALGVIAFAGLAAVAPDHTDKHFGEKNDAWFINDEDSNDSWHRSLRSRLGLDSFLSYFNITDGNWGPIPPHNTIEGSIDPSVRLEDAVTGAAAGGFVESRNDLPGAEPELQAEQSVIDQEALDQKIEAINDMTLGELQWSYSNMVTGNLEAHEIANVELLLNDPNQSATNIYNVLRRDPNALAMLEACTNGGPVSFENCSVDTDPEGAANFAEANELRERLNNIDPNDIEALRAKAIMSETVIARLMGADFLGTKLHTGPYNTTRINDGKFESSTNDRINDVWIGWAFTDAEGNVHEMWFRECLQNVKPVETVETPVEETPEETVPVTTTPATTPTTVPTTTTPGTTVPTTTPPTTTPPTTTPPTTTPPTTTPPTTTPPTTTPPTTTGIPPKNDSNTTPGGVPGQNGGSGVGAPGTPTGEGEGPSGQPVDSDGSVGGEVLPTAPAAETTTPEVTQPTVPAETGVDNGPNQPVETIPGTNNSTPVGTTPDASNL
ncbi:MAG: hypothetical protein M3Q70_03480 [bacterium]|nr:hypothetical protein [bacterium]